MLGFYNYTTWLTYLGALCGVSGIVCSALGTQGGMIAAVILLSVAGLIDGFDGKVASTKKDRTDDMRKFGIQIDSLSDLLSFGMLPAAMLLGFARLAFPDLTPLVFLPLAGLFVLAALVRLAYFNVSEENRQKEETGSRKYYQGIPVTLVSIFVPLGYGFSELLRFIVNGDAQAWRRGYFIFLCLELAFFGFGFLFKKLKVAKLHGKKMIFLIALGTVGAAGVVVSAILNAA